MDISKILKSDYLDILFEGRNKKYGGYELRKKYPTRARNAVIGTLAVAGLIAAGPVLATIFKAKEPKKEVISMKQVTLAEPPPIEPNKPKPPPPPPAPPAPARPTVKFTPPVIKPNEEVKEDVKPPDEKKNEVAGPVTVAGDPNASELAPPTATPGTGTGVEATAAPAIFTYVEQQPVFNGDVGAYLQSHLNYPESAREAGVEGRVGIKFVVNETGAISNVEVVRSAGNAALDAEAKRVVSSMPKWKPGMNNGTAVKVYFTLPITFKLD